MNVLCIKWTLEDTGGLLVKVLEGTKYRAYTVLVLRGLNAESTVPFTCVMI